MFYPSTLAVYFYNNPEGQGRIFKLGPTNLHVDSPACAFKLCGDWTPRAPEWSPLTRDPRPGAPLDNISLRKPLWSLENWVGRGNEFLDSAWTSGDKDGGFNISI